MYAQASGVTRVGLTRAAGGENLGDNTGRKFISASRLQACDTSFFFECAILGTGCRKRFWKAEGPSKQTLGGNRTNPSHPMRANRISPLTVRCKFLMQSFFFKLVINTDELSRLQVCFSISSLDPTTF